MAKAVKKTATRAENSGLCYRLRRDRSGATAIEFAILILPFMMAVFATLETFIAFTAEQLVASAVDDMARDVRTGAITFGLGRSTDMTETQFREAFCNKVALLIKCSSTEAATPAKLYIDLKEVASFGAISTNIPRVDSTNDQSDLDTSGLKFSPGNSGAINSFRVYYRWSVTVDLVRPWISNLIPNGETKPSEFLIVATNAFRNEAYP